MRMKKKKGHDWSHKNMQRKASEGAFVSMTNCHTCLKEGLKMVDLKDWRIVVEAGSGIEVNIRTRDPCDALAISGGVVKILRQMDKEPKAKVMS